MTKEEQGESQGFHLDENLTWSSSRSEASSWLGTISVSISDMTLMLPLTTSSSLRSRAI